MPGFEASSGVDQPLLSYNRLLRATLQITRRRKRRSINDHDLFFARWGRAPPAPPSGSALICNLTLYLLLSGFARGQALRCHAVARADRMQKSMQKHCRAMENDWSIVLNRRLPVSTFSPNHWS